MCGGGGQGFKELKFPQWSSSVQDKQRKRSKAQENEMKDLASESNDGNDYGFPEFFDNSRNLGKSWHAR